MNYERLYQYRFRGVDPRLKDAVWRVIARWIHANMGAPASILDPAAGQLEFLRAIDAQEKVGVDLQRPDEQLLAAHGIRFIQGDIFAVDLPARSLDGVYLSNFLEHLSSPEDIYRLLTKLHAALRPGGRLAVMGPNFKYCPREYFDCADHKLALTHVAVEELLFAAGFKVRRSIARFLPFSFRSRLPQTPALVRAYLAMPWAWRLFGKQFLIFAEA